MADLRQVAQALLDAIDAALPYAPHRCGFDRVSDLADDLRRTLAQAEPVRTLTDDERAAIDFFSRNPSVAPLAWAHWIGRSKSAPTAEQQQAESVACPSCEELGYVPLSEDGRSVFIDGIGLVPLARQAEPAVFDSKKAEKT